MCDVTSAGSLARLYTHHRFDHEFERGTAVRCSYVVCSVPRSGSSLLCEMLCLAGSAGAPTEYFDRTQAELFARTWGTRTFEEYLDALLDRKTGPNGVFGVKVHHDQLGDLLADRDLAGLFPHVRYVSIRRRDTLAQAVSYAVAVQTGQWASTHGSAGPARYDRRLVDELRSRVQADEAAWRDWFAARGVRPLEVVYEDLVDDPVRELDRVLAHLGLDPAPPDVMAGVTLERQADRRSRLWAARHRLGGVLRRGGPARSRVS